MRQAFNFYRSYFDVLADIKSDSEKLEYLMALLNKQFKGIEPEFVGEWSKAMYNSQKFAINKSVEGWEFKTGQRLYQPDQDPSVGPTEGPNKEPYLQEEEQEQVKEEVKVKEDINTDTIIGNFFSEPEKKPVTYSELPWDSLNKDEKKMAEDYLENLLSQKI